MDLRCSGRSVTTPPSWIEGDERQGQFVRRPPFGGFSFPGDPLEKWIAFLLGACGVNGKRLAFSEGSGRRRGLAVLTAVLVDALLGDPPSRIHPVAWMGSWIEVLRRRAPRRGPLTELLYGAAGMGVSATVLWVVGRWAAGLLQRWRLGWLVEGAILSQLIAWRGLMRAGAEVAGALDRGDLGEARRQLGWHLVSRDVSELDGGLVAAGTIESLAENSSDSMIAPLFWYGIGGLPAALAYRFLNTADAVLGYRDVEREWLGKSAARGDDFGQSGAGAFDGAADRWRGRHWGREQRQCMADLAAGWGKDGEPECGAGDERGGGCAGAGAGEGGALPAWGGVAEAGGR